jgi:hypothetical protein
MAYALDTTTDAAQQKDNLCGPFWAARVLHDFGVDEWDGEQIDEDLIALRAGTVLPDSPEGSVPVDAHSRTDYRYRLPTAPAAASGTAAGPLADAIEHASEGALRCVPLRGAWTAERVERLVEATPAVGARLLANVRTGALWASRPPLEALLAELAGRPAPDPPADWDVGHFFELASLVRGTHGSLVLVHDSYPSFGWNAHHLQPPRAIAAALLRGDGREGGVLAIAPRRRAAEIEAAAAELELDVAIWDNGTRR